jgi:outer membrane immunogenic protein
MRKLLLGSAMTLAFAGTAAAADLPVYSKAPPWSWTGCYIGAHVGGGTMWSEWTQTTPANSSSSASPGIGVVGGGQVGCNYQIRQFVLGAEGEVWGSSIKTQNVGDFFNAFNNEISESQAKNTFDATIALRAGFALDRSLFYGKVGVDWGRFDLTSLNCFNCNGLPTTQSATVTVPGLLLGAGFEYAFLDNWSAKIEYDYIAFGTATVNSTGVGGGFPNSQANTNAQSKQIVKAGLNYMFNWGGGPLMTKY